MSGECLEQKRRTFLGYSGPANTARTRFRTFLHAAAVGCDWNGVWKRIASGIPGNIEQATAQYGAQIVERVNFTRNARENRRSAGTDHWSRGLEA